MSCHTLLAPVSLYKKDTSSPPTRFDIVEGVARYRMVRRSLIIRPATAALDGWLNCPSSRTSFPSSIPLYILSQQHIASCVFGEKRVMALSLSLLSFKSGEKTNCEIVFLVAGNGIYYVARSNHSLLDIYDLSPFCFKTNVVLKVNNRKERWEVGP